MLNRLELTDYYRIVLTSMVSVAIVLVGMAAIAAVGAGTVVDARAHPTTEDQAPPTPSTPNAVTNASYALSRSMRMTTLSASRGLYGICLTATHISAESGRIIGRGSKAAAVGTWNGIAYAGKTIGNAVVTTVSMPGKLIGSVSDAPAVDNFVRPASNSSITTIDTEAADAIVARYNEQQQKEIAELQAEQLDANHNLGGTVLAGDAKHGGYPARLDNARKDALVDDWGMFNRECVSYAAWKVHQTFGSMPYWGGVGNANQWVANARRAGIPTSTVPRVHSVAISMSGYYGHAMWVEKVAGDMIYVSQYNYDLDGRYSEMWVEATGLTYIYFN